MPYYLQALIISSVALVVACLATRLLVPILNKKGVVDIPNQRSSHAAPIPRGGGLGIVLGLAAGLGAARLLGLAAIETHYYVVVLLISVVGFLDDLFRLPVWIRTVAQILAASLVIYHFGSFYHLPFLTSFGIQMKGFSVVFTLVWIVGITNIYNFLDGIDGYAALQAVFTGLVLACWNSRLKTFGLNPALVGASLGFLWWNWHPARIFMGDVGSTTIGFLFATMPFLQTPDMRDETGFLVVASLWFFIADGATAILRRILRKERFWEPHRSHLYQRLAAAKMPHSRIALVNVALTIVPALLAFWSARRESAWGQVVTLTAAVSLFVVYRQWVLRKIS